MAVQTTSTMSLEHFHDFYLLVALQAAVLQEKSSNPEIEFSKSFEKFEDDLERTCEKLYDNMALRTFMYLYAACLGEARHAKDTVAQERFLMSIKSSRESVFSKITNYPPTKENLKALVSIFEQEWRSGYGGTAWKNIAVALTEYGSLSPAAWIDHVVDLEHNNGTAFSKPEGKGTIFFDVNYPNRFSSFLDYKFSHDILTEKPSFVKVLTVSPRVAQLLSRYSTILNKKTVSVDASLENLTDYNVVWGKKILRVAKKSEWERIGDDNKPDVFMLLSEAGLYEVYAGSVTFEELEKHVGKVMGKAQKHLGRNGKKNVATLKKLYKVSSAWLARHKNKCLLPKPPVTYKVLPCKIEKTAKSNVKLIFDLPYQEGYGTKEGDGFCVTPKVYGMSLSDGESGYVKKYYNDLILYVDGNSLYVQNQILEALVD